jgi:Rieske Fe-S protein
VTETSLPRRSLLVGGAVTVAAGIVGFFVARDKWAPSTGTIQSPNGYGSPPAAAGVLLTPLGSVPAGGGIVLASKGVVVTRDADGTAVHGFSSICTHQGCTVSTVAGGTIDCPCHGSRFNAQTGAVVQGPATRPLPAVAVEIRGADVYRS